MNAIFFKSSARFTSLVAASILFAASNQASAAAYAFTDLGTLGGGANSVARSINNIGQIVGESGISGNAATHATLWNGAIATDLGTLGGTNSHAYGINNVGQVVGYSDITGDKLFHATLWNGAATTDLGALPGVFGYSLALDINDSGQAVGYSELSDTDPSNLVQATLWDGATTTTFGVLDGMESVARGINNSGQIVGDDSGSAILWDGTARTALDGQSADAINDSGQIIGLDNDHRATLWDGATTTDLGLGILYYVEDINASGQVVGANSFDGGNSFHATFWDGTATFDLNSLLDASTTEAGWVLTSASGINDSGAIVGTASNSRLGIDSHAFLMTPVPEPEIHAMLLAGLGVVGFMARRRKRR